MFTGANHLCIVTGDIDRAVRAWADGVGVGPWSVYTYDETTMTTVVDGEPRPFAMRVALCQLGGGFAIELIQPLDDNSPYADSLQAHDGSDHFHHVKLDVDDFDGAAATLASRGMGITFDGRFPGVVGEAHGRYFNTADELGIVIEVGELSPDFAMHAPDYEYPVVPGSPARA